MNGVAAELDPAPGVPPVPGQRPQGLGAARCGCLIDGGDYAADARTLEHELFGADADLLPVVLRVRIDAADHEIGPEAVHGQRALQPRVEGIEGGLRED